MADLLVDEGIGQDLVQQLRAMGFRVFHTLEFHPKGSSDALVFVEAQRRKLTIFTWNRDDYMLLAEAWSVWGHGDHYGVITRARNRPQLPPQQTLPILEHYCLDSASFLNRIALF